MTDQQKFNFGKMGGKIFHRKEMSDQICSWKSVIGTISDKGMQDYALGLGHETKIDSMIGIVDEERRRMW